MGDRDTDERGRRALSEKRGERSSGRYRVVELRDGILVVPVADNPVEGFRDAVGDAFEGKSISEVKHEARDTAQERHSPDR
jgi:hypothetical protein